MHLDLSQMEALPYCRKIGELYRRGYQDGNTTPLFRVNQPESVLRMNKRNYGSFDMTISGGSAVDRERSVYERAFVCIR